MGRGHITPHGTGWRVYAYAGTDPVTGKERRLTKVVHGTRRDAERALAGLLARAATGQVPAGGHTLGSAIDAFLAHKALSIEATTLDSYRSQAGYIPAKLRAMPLHKVGPEHLDGLYAHLATTGRAKGPGGLSPVSIHNVHRFLHGVFELARRYRWVTTNPVSDAQPPRVRRREPTPVPTGALGELLAGALTNHGPAFAAYLRVSITAGGRRSEVHGLRWSGVDFARGRVTFRDVIVRAGGHATVKPRTKTGRPRTVDIDPGTLEALRSVHETAFAAALACGAALPRDAFVFADIPGGPPWNPATTYSRWQRCCATAGLPLGTRLHDLRQLMATHLIDQGVPVPVVASRLGHALNSTTLDIYTGRVAASDALAAEVMGRLLDRPS